LFHKNIFIKKQLEVFLKGKKVKTVFRRSF